MELEPEDFDREYTPELQENGTTTYVFQNTYAWYCTAYGFWSTCHFKKDGLTDEILNHLFGTEWVRL